MYNSLMFHIHCVDINPCTCYHFDWIWQLLACFLAWPIRTVDSGFKWPIRTGPLDPSVQFPVGSFRLRGLIFNYWETFHRWCLKQVNSHMYHFVVTHRDIVLQCTFINLKHTIFGQMTTNHSILHTLVYGSKIVKKWQYLEIYCQ